MREVLQKIVVIVIVIATILTVMSWYLPFWQGKMGTFSIWSTLCNCWSCTFMILGVAVAIIQLGTNISKGQ
ncbi:MAG: hypothetical protein PHR36_00625 [Patescibacteria group bacterium]|nr:hypothetical protein [Patescibacteria group bacterium]